MTKKQKKVLYRIIITILLLIVLHIAHVYLGEDPRYEDGSHIREWVVGEPVWLLLYMIPYLVIGYDILRKAFKGIMNREVFDENFLMAVATVGAICLGEYREGVAVMLFYQIGELFQAVAVGKSRRNISALMDIRPDYANIENEAGELKQVSPDEVAVGSVIVVCPGEKIPLDGVVTEGSSTLNTSALTGESVPREVEVGDEVISGCVNTSGLLKIQTTKEFGESTVSRILELVENSSMKKSRSENFITKFAKYYTPAVCYGALALAVLPPVVNFSLGHQASWSTWIIRALTFLVISCPCALVISIPLSFFGGIGGASACGILVKGSNYLEALAQTGCVVFDKTGTLTKGVFQVTKTAPAEEFVEKFGDADALLYYAAHAESYSSHPISKSLRDAYDKRHKAEDKTKDMAKDMAENKPDSQAEQSAVDRDKGKIDNNRVNDVEEISGHGVTALVDGHRVAAGNMKLMAKLGLQEKAAAQREANEKADAAEEIGTVVYVAVDGAYAGYILIADVPKDTAKEAIAALKRSGVRKTVMLTGDGKAVAEHVAQELGIDEVHSELLPADKVSCVEQLLAAKKKKENLAFVGDGINDAPVLSRADIGIAMGAMGSDAAIEAADVVLMDDNPAKIALAMKISRKCLRIVYENIVFALSVKAICLILGALGLAGMWLAIFADVGVMVLAVLNAIRCLKVK
ncbi:MAG: heavy metal translocating P-type ATPase [Lachnospiraceae bacterium]|nr:heavy metal translocating P-type ATPase [Lachnospiraceae bacterium]